MILVCHSCWMHWHDFWFPAKTASAIGVWHLSVKKVWMEVKQDMSMTVAKSGTNPWALEVWLRWYYSELMDPVYSSPQPLVDKLIPEVGLSLMTTWMRTEEWHQELSWGAIVHEQKRCWYTSNRRRMCPSRISCLRNIQCWDVSVSQEACSCQFLARYFHDHFAFWLRKICSLWSIQ